MDDRDALAIELQFHAEGGENFIKLLVVERDASGDHHYFFISDRSKGFFWFFNFVMKLEFNPKVRSDDDSSTIYLLDEPGSYLHASAQSKLCNKLKSLSAKNRVIYCTHSHYLLDPEVIPLSTIHVADRDNAGAIGLFTIHEHRGSVTDRHSAYQPVLDALQIKPFVLDLTHRHIVITEGITDYYALELWKQGRQLGVLPSVGAPSPKFLVSLMLAWRVDFKVLWDNDDAGVAARGEAERLFGEELAREHFLLLPLEGQPKRILQNLFDGADLVMFRDALGLSRDTSFEKTLAALFYSELRTQLVAQAGATTKANFDRLFEAIGFE